jgi:hypothetical protein
VVSKISTAHPSVLHIALKIPMLIAGAIIKGRFGYTRRIFGVIKIFMR